MSGGVAFNAPSCEHCDDPVRAKGLCAKHYARWSRHGDPLFDGVKEVTRNGKTYTRRVRANETGYGRTPLYRAWKAMHRRCYEEKASNFKWYGGRGITICEEWHDFLVFRAWAEEHGYVRGAELDRIDKDGPYAPENCRYIDKRANIDRKGRNAPVVTLDKKVYEALDRASGGESLDSLATRIIAEWLAGSPVETQKGGDV